MKRLLKHIDNTATSARQILLLSVFTFGTLLAPASAQSPTDSMGINAARKNWKAAIHWALKAAEARPADKYWRYMNAANYASEDHDADLTLHYASLVIDSDIATRVIFGKNFDWLRHDARWVVLMEKVAVLKERQRQQRIQASLPFRDQQQKLLSETDGYLNSLAAITDVNQLYRQIRDPLPAHHYSQPGRFHSAWYQWSDSLDFPFLVQLPDDFDAGRAYPLVVVLHGAVGRQAALPDVVDSTLVPPFFGYMFSELARENEMIAVFPYSTQKYNWMMPDDGFELVPGLVRQVKKMYRTDDSRIYITGHSNGATGAFSYLMKQPGLFAAFAGVNNRPQVRTGGTFLRNLSNRSFYNVATDYDYYFPLEGHRTLKKLTSEMHLDWENREVTGQRSHGYLVNARDSTVREVYHDLFKNMLAKKRNPFQPNLYWECDDLKNGRADWLEINKLDTLAKKADWHTELNVTVSGWRNVEDPKIASDSISRAFEFPRRSGAVQAAYADNRFELTTSRVGSISIYLSPEMVDFKRPLQVVINGKLVYNAVLSMDREFLLREFSRDMDRQAIWANRISLDIP